ncbi:Por secretion system C-terminal sorting domain-containing protein [Flaviramulus basaltis]|uniref:Por secretion system C-terminal sorting domain-containing protein n=1 Tax=Flaviramulus basaltis TaxID=369401 RepID=A0A1K2IR88_9FLAO|nr:T9SS type A sorting domain-containing protein [Flaviramulus basaltis]SFZ94972.1 Por secretion system C-terminal sorting domain-containing protein [Flaviramulus basaltis]
MEKKYFICKILIFFNFINGYSQIVNKGILQISSSTNVYFEEEYINTVSGVHNNNGNLYLNSNFINNGKTSSLSGTTHFASSTNPEINISGLTNALNLYNLEINITALNTKGILVADNFELNVVNSINFVSGDMRLVGKSQLIQTHLGANINKVTSGKILVDQQRYSSAYKFNYWSSPVNNSGGFSLFGGKFDGTDSSVNAFRPQQILFNSGAHYNGTATVVDAGSNVITPLSINTNWLYKYFRGSGSYAGWVNINQNSVLNPGVGYTMKGTNTVSEKQNYVFYGEPNNGEYLLPISIGEESLLGNPYPCALDAKKFILDNLLILDALHFWIDGGSTSHMLSGHLGGYATRNLTGGIPPSILSPLISSGSVTTPKQFVPIGEGFFVEAYGTGSIVFNNSQRVFKTQTSSDEIFNKNTNEKKIQNQYIRIGHEDPEGFHRQLLLGFLPNSTADIKYNHGYDAIMKDAREDDLFFIIENDLDKKYAIQGLDSFVDTMEFPLGILIKELGNQQIMLDNVENFTHTVYLKDKYLNTTHNLSESSLNVNLSIGEHLDRFSIVFLTQNTLLINNNQIETIKVLYDGKENIIVANNKNLEIKNIIILNMLGQEILKLNKNINNQSKIIIPFNKDNGVYLVNIETDNSKITQKILKN